MSQPTTHATPLYNTAILQDTSIIAHLNYIHAFTTIPSFVDACKLAKIWLFKRGFTKSPRDTVEKSYGAGTYL
jgi:U3 small nucleolar RNA-associated protein 22